MDRSNMGEGNRLRQGYWESQMEPQGTERYFRFGTGRNTGYEEAWEQRDRRYDSCRTNITGSFQDGCYLLDYHYCLWKVRLGDVKNPHRTEYLQGSLGDADLLVKNPKGVFAISMWGISWFTPEGELVKRISLAEEYKERIIHPYLCGTILYYLKEEGSYGSWTAYSAYMMDLESGEETCIVKAFYEESRKWNMTMVESVWATLSVMGNEKGAVLCLEVNSYRTDENSEIWEGLESADEWYYYDFKQLYCLSSPQYDPLKNPEEYVQARGNGSMMRRTIRAFDMQKNIMWVLKEPCDEEGDYEEWEAMTLEPLPQKRGDLPVWKIPRCLERAWRIYFDGEFCYAYEGGYFCSFASDGSRERWKIKTHGGNDDMTVLKDCIRFYSMDGEKFQYYPKSHRQLDCLVGTDKADGYEQASGYSLKELYEMKSAEQRESEVSQTEEGFSGGGQAGNAQTLKKTGYPGWPYDAQSPAFEEYWEGFRRYLQENGLDSALRPGTAGDYNFYYINWSPRIYLECDVNKNSLRTAFIVKKLPEIFARIMEHREEIDRKLQDLGECAWKGDADAANFNIHIPVAGIDVEEQYAWFRHTAEAMYDAAKDWLQ